MYKFILVVVFILLMAACGNTEATKEAMELSLAGDTIIVNEKSPF